MARFPNLAENGESAGLHGAGRNLRSMQGQDGRRRMRRSFQVLSMQTVRYRAPFPGLFGGDILPELRVPRLDKEVRHVRLPLPDGWPLPVLHAIDRRPL